MASINQNLVRSIIEDKLAVELAASPAVPVVFHNQPYISTSNSSWVQCLTSFGQSQYLTLGGETDSSNSVIGITAINVFTPKGVGSGANLDICSRIRNLFNREILTRYIYRILLEDGSFLLLEDGSCFLLDEPLPEVHIDPPIGPDIVRSPAPEGYFQTQMRITFEAFEDL
jgi:hypothetical protein